MSKKRKRRLTGLLMSALGLVCALLVAALFYAAMAYQLAGTDGADALPGEEPRGALALGEGELISQSQSSVEMGGIPCTVLARTYALSDGATAEAITAQPAAYLQRMSQEGWQPQLITGFVLAGLDAVYATRGDECLLAARDGERVYLLRVPADEQRAYALGASAVLEDLEQ